MAQLFLSYAREDRECAELFARELSARGWTVWWDRRIQVGRSFSEVIERELDDASCVVVLWSRHAVTSPWVKTEATEAAQRRVLVPVRIEEVRLPLEFRPLHTADLFEWRTRLEGPEFEDCLASIELLAPKNTTSAFPVQPAPNTTQVHRSPEPEQRSNGESDSQAPSSSARPSPTGFWISQDGRQFYVTESAAATPTPSAPRKSNRGRIRAFGIACFLMIVLVIISVESRPSGTSTSDTAATETSGTTATPDTAATDTSGTGMTTADTAATSTGSLSTDMVATVATTDTTTTGPISVSLENDCSKSIAVAICYKNSAGVMFGEGWFHVDPDKTAVDVIQAYGRKIYFYAETNGWNWEGEAGDSMTRSFSVTADTRKQFQAVDGEFKGDGIKVVPFFGRTVDEGQSKYRLPFTCTGISK
ncbi:MAG TPA: toll/interleukin-1 receptor domain-containing protein [Thermoanaerobaculia bacterium]|jgi:uncharacterized membrane protein|nr:toll/interleukin-1 receptor domain-containing protein [Thermoanaerobaculia bacterium]